ncbi:MAG: hypothetical protein EAZ36_03330 [Verrucomicrobia bacterium]|nr:MAG: hypothetical protein EAZ36_03330 [Verrucomicrobiota bacterium]
MPAQRRTVLTVFVVALGGSQVIGYFAGARFASACDVGMCFVPRIEVEHKGQATTAPSKTDTLTQELIKRAP